MAKPAKKPPVMIEAIECNSTEASKLLGITKPLFDRRVSDGWIKPIGKDRFRIGDVIRGNKAALSDEHGRRRSSAAAARVQEARAQKIEIRTQRDTGKLVDTDDSVAFISETIGALRSRLFGIPAASTRDLDARGQVERSVEAAVAKIRARFDALAAACRGSSSRPGAEDDQD